MKKGRGRRIVGLRRMPIRTTNIGSENAADKTLVTRMIFPKHVTDLFYIFVYFFLLSSFYFNSN